MSTPTTVERAVEAIKDAADNADEAQRKLARVRELALTAGNQPAIDKWTRLAEVSALVSISQSLGILAALTLKTAAEAEEIMLGAADEGIG